VTVERADHSEREAKESVQARLALFSMIIWLSVTLAIVLPLRLNYGLRPAYVIMIGFAALLVAALPWLAYRRLVRRRLRSMGQRKPVRRAAAGR
jgi:uncharacterized membrane-anchored protein